MIGRTLGPRAYVERNFAHHAVAIHMAVSNDDGLHIFEPHNAVIRKLGPDEDGIYLPPFLRLDEDMARELLDALAAHFGGTSEVQTLRKDYLHERGRVDKMIDHLIGRTNG